MVESNNRRVALLKKMGLFDDRSNIVVRRAISYVDLAAAYRLVYRVFVEKGFVNPLPGGIRVRAFEGVPEMTTFVAEEDGEIVGVMSIVPDIKGLGLPSDQAFAGELGLLRSAGRKVSEITNLAVAAKYRRSNAFTELTRACFAQALAWKCDDIFIAISPGHAIFFEDVLQFDACGDRRSYSAEKMDIVEGKRLDLRRVEDRWLDLDRVMAEQAFLHAYYYQDNPYHDCVDLWSHLAVEAFFDARFLHELFVERSRLLDRCTPQEVKALRHRWGTKLFDRVFGPRPVGGDVATSVATESTGHDAREAGLALYSLRPAC
jgi:hypothetical protein